ncbi:unnamed protein product [Lactuca saligna]|uniref:Uncharacterized protein n=1 Tax=Lactuca saligna TaxID=75948 RepID=A0AA36A168_LACSI|nr:unnamed protein product [Lactuca saligna]
MKQGTVIWKATQVLTLQDLGPNHPIYIGLPTPPQTKVRIPLPHRSKIASPYKPNIRLMGSIILFWLYKGCISYWSRQQPNHGHTTTFSNIYHPPQPVTTGAVDPLAGGGPCSVDMVGPATAASVYQQQQPQATQINWPNNY